MKQAIKQNKHRDSMILTFQVDRTDSARRCMDLFKDKISLKGYTLDVVGSRHDLPDNIRRGYDYDDPALWRSDLYNVYISKSINSQKTTDIESLVCVIF